LGHPWPAEGVVLKKKIQKFKFSIFCFVFREKKKKKSPKNLNNIKPAHTAKRRAPNDGDRAPVASRDDAAQRPGRAADNTRPFGVEPRGAERIAQHRVGLQRRKLRRVQGQHNRNAWQRLQVQRVRLIARLRVCVCVCWRY
jgi:hypothetical protein